MPDRARDGDSSVEAAVAAPTLQPLVCSACGGPVPLGNGDEVQCPYCRAPVAVPPEYQALRAADRERAGDETSIAELYARIGEPPGLLLRLWGSAIGGAVIVIAKIVVGFLWIWVMLLGLVFRLFSEIDDARILLAVLLLPFGVLFAIVWALAKALHLLAPPLGVDLVDVGSLAGTFLGIGAAIYVVCVIPLALYRYGEAFARVRQRLQSCLAARPPRAAGGPAVCRQCGAALTVAPGALGARCVYCQSDNLVALPPRWVTRVKDKTKTFHHQVASAEAEERASRKLASAKARAIVLWSVAVPVVTAGLGYAMGRFHLVENHSGWQAAVAMDRELLPHACTVFEDCAGDRPDAWDVAVRRGESLLLEYRGHGAPEGVSLRGMDRGRAFPVEWKAGQRGAYRARIDATASGWLVIEGVQDKGDWKVSLEEGKPERS